MDEDSPFLNFLEAFPLTPYFVNTVFLSYLNLVNTTLPESTYTY
jgi:hypothetical protein